VTDDRTFYITENDIQFVFVLCWGLLTIYINISWQR